MMSIRRHHDLRARMCIAMVTRHLCRWLKTDESSTSHKHTPCLIYRHGFVLTTSKTASTNGCDLALQSMSSAPNTPPLGDASTLRLPSKLPKPEPPSDAVQIIEMCFRGAVRHVCRWARAMRGQRVQELVYISAANSTGRLTYSATETPECAAVSIPSPEFHRRPWIGHIDLAGYQLRVRMEVLGHTCQNPPRRFLNTCIKTCERPDGTFNFRSPVLSCHIDRRAVLSLCSS
jgi:hypothetical protein